MHYIYYRSHALENTQREIKYSVIFNRKYSFMKMQRPCDMTWILSGRDVLLFCINSKYRIRDS